MKIYLFTHTGDVDESLKQKNVTFINLNLSKTDDRYFESRGYELINLPEDEEETICFISPSVFKKTLMTIEQIMQGPPAKNNEIFCFIKHGHALLAMYQAQMAHGNTFLILWNYFLEKMGLLQYAGIDFSNCNCNMYYIKCKQAKQFQLFMKKGIHCLNSFKGYYKELLHSDSKYNGTNNISKQDLQKKFGYPHYPFHPFIAERFIGLFALINNIPVILK